MRGVQGYDKTAIAHRYGYDPRGVRRFLALGTPSPRVLAALAAGKINVATAQAFTVTQDPARKEAVLRTAGSAYELRRLVTKAKIRTVCSGSAAPKPMRRRAAVIPAICSRLKAKHTPTMPS